MALFYFEKQGPTSLAGATQSESFFDPDADEPVALDPDYVQGQILTAMGAAGVDPAIAYAYRKTGLLLDESLGVDYDPNDLREWREAIAEYRRTHSKAEADPAAAKQEELPRRSSNA